MTSTATIHELTLDDGANLLQLDPSDVLYVIEQCGSCDGRDLRGHPVTVRPQEGEPWHA
jgi:hypothetical protein